MNRDRASARRRGEAGFTLIEMLAVVVIIGILAIVAVPKLFAAITRAQNARAIAEISNIHKAVEQYRLVNGALPLTMADMVPAYFLQAPTDPWGRPYEYNNFDVITPGARRKDGPLVPINKEFDIFSVGPDGMSTPNIHSAPARDDIIFANDGGFIDVATEY